MGKQPEKAPILKLKLLSGAETLMLDALGGEETLANAKEVFRMGIDGKFKKLGINNKAGIATKKQAVDVHEIVMDATFAQTFGSLGTDLEKLCLTQAQIKNFCKKYPEWIRKDGGGNLFLFKSDEQFFVADVCVCYDVDSEGLNVCVFRFTDNVIWLAEYSHRLVVPRLIA